MIALLVIAACIAMADGDRIVGRLMINWVWTSLLAELRSAGELWLRIGQGASDRFGSVPLQSRISGAYL